MLKRKDFLAFTLCVSLVLFFSIVTIHAEEYSYPDNIPLEAEELLEPMELTGVGARTEDYPRGLPATNPLEFWAPLHEVPDKQFSEEDVEKLKEGNYTAVIAMHVMDAAWPEKQVEGITTTLEKFGIEVIAVTDADYSPSKQANDVEQLLTMEPDLLFSIPLDPSVTAPAFKAAAEQGTKVVFLDSVPDGLIHTEHYVSVTASDNVNDAYWAAKAMCEKIIEEHGGGDVTIIDSIYNQADVLQARQEGYRKAIGEFDEINLYDYGNFQTPQNAYDVAMGQLTANPDIKGMAVMWDNPAGHAINAAQTLGHNDLIIATTGLGPTSAMRIARDEIYSVGANRPYDQGVSEAKSGALALLGREVPPFFQMPTLRVKKINLLSGMRIVMNEEPSEELIKDTDGESF